MEDGELPAEEKNVVVKAGADAKKEAVAVKVRNTTESKVGVRKLPAEEKNVVVEADADADADARKKEAAKKRVRETLARRKAELELAWQSAEAKKLEKGKTD